MPWDKPKLYKCTPEEVAQMVRDGAIVKASVVSEEPLLLEVQKIRVLVNRHPLIEMGVVA